MGEGFEATSVKDNTERSSITSVGDSVMAEADSSEVMALGLNDREKIEADGKNMMAQRIISPCSETEDGSWNFPRWQAGNGATGDQILLAAKPNVSTQSNYEVAEGNDEQPVKTIDDNYRQREWGVPWRPNEQANPNDWNPLARPSMNQYCLDLLQANGIDTKDGAKVNAFRHCFGSAYEAYKYGSSLAEVAGSGYESATSTMESLNAFNTNKDRSKELKLDHAIDLHNNKVGRHAGWNARKEGKSWNEVEATLIKAIRNVGADGLLPEGLEP